MFLASTDLMVREINCLSMYLLYREIYELTYENKSAGDGWFKGGIDGKTGFGHFRNGEM